ncbi:hydantoinase B/oxoprolinase family protein [Henriciella aquimarina]|uniref:hydantoinase B/oxoprolinase family protein n=1 Tax=Henriciella aquimarina TaxID=545261 RepID=UPI000A0351FB|nr:hydantoinase B/oxoprolinase family protein [Henriciella aquimarina]
MADTAIKEPKAAEVDPITLEVVRNGLLSTVIEMTENLVRTAYSPIAAEVKDFSLCLLDANGDVIMQTPHAAPGFVADLDKTIKTGLDLYGRDGLEEGDVIVANNSELAGQHLNNVAIYTPVFVGGEIVAFAAVRSHWIDVGGAVSGSMSSKSKDIFAEGIQIPTMKVYSAGKPVAEVHRLIETNSRFPDLVLGDMRAQISACRLGERRFGEMVRKYGLDAVKSCINRISDDAETVARNAISAIPDGVYEASCHLDTDGVNLDQPVPLHVKLIIEGSEMTIDFSGMSPQVEGPCNSRAADTIARLGFKFITAPGTPVTSGAFRNLKIVCPEGTIVSADWRAPMGWWGMTINSTIDLMLRALFPALPDGVTAGHTDNIGAGAVSGVDPRNGKMYQTLVPFTGAWGATSQQDGLSAVVSLAQGDVRITPVELREAMFPIHIEQFSLRPDSGGPGRNRGGLGAIMVTKALAKCNYDSRYERTFDPPWGLAGGKPGKITETYMTHEGSDEKIDLPLTAHQFVFEKGDTEHLYGAGGGGFGNPFERPVEKVQDDVVKEYVSLEQARESYGVVLDPDTLEVNAAETEALRKKLMDSAAG